MEMAAAKTIVDVVSRASILERRPLLRDFYPLCISATSTIPGQTHHTKMLTHTLMVWFVWNEPFSY